MTVCDNARSQGIKFDDVFFMRTEIARTDSTWTRGLNFRVTVTSAFSIKKKKRDHNILKFVRYKLIGTRHRFCDYDRDALAMSSTTPTKRHDHWLIKKLSLVKRLRSGGCEIGLICFPEPSLALPKLYENSLNCFSYRRNCVNFAERCGYV